MRSLRRIRSTLLSIALGCTALAAVGCLSHDASDRAGLRQRGIAPVASASERTDLGDFGALGADWQPRHEVRRASP